MRVWTLFNFLHRYKLRRLILKNLGTLPDSTRRSKLFHATGKKLSRFFEACWFCCFIKQSIAMDEGIHYLIKIVMSKRPMHPSHLK